MATTPSIKLSPSQSAPGDLKRVVTGLGKFGCLCGKAGTSINSCSSSTRCSGCVVNGPIVQWLLFKFYLKDVDFHITLISRCMQTLHVSVCE